MSELLDATEAARRLGVKPATLYAYVSRGLLRSVPVHGSRRRGYPRSEVEALRRRSREAADPTSAARSALDWGLPVLDTELTAISGGTFSYRGRDALELARRSTPERVAALLWLGDETAEVDLFGEALEPPPAEWWAVADAHPDAHPSTVLDVAVRLRQCSDPGAADRRRERMARSGAGTLRALVAAAARLRRRRRGSLSSILQRQWARDRDDLERVLSTTLVLCADHELNVSSFTARCIASAGASVHDAVSGGLAALRGVRHGGHSDRAEALLRETGIGAGGAPAAADLRRRLTARLARGEPLPGFRHPLYPEGDPRFAALVESLERAVPRSRVLLGVRRLAEAGEAVSGDRANVDLGLAMVAREMGLPLGGAWTLFAVGRTIGWVAHALEERERDRLIRPRARYVGAQPDR